MWGLQLRTLTGGACLLATLATTSASESAPPGAEARLVLHASLVGRTLAREAFSPVKNARLGLDFRREARELRRTFAEARTERELVLAVKRLSDLREDGHLHFVPAAGTLSSGSTPVPVVLQAPIRFAVDYADSDRPHLFVADVGRSVAEGVRGRPRVGDRVVEIHGTPVAEWVERIDPWIPAATRERLWLEAAVNASALRADMPTELHGELAIFTLERQRGSRRRVRYELRLPWLPPSSVRWRDPAGRPAFDGSPAEEPQAFIGAGFARAKSYAGFRRVVDADGFALFRATDTNRKVLVLDWKHFRKTERDVAALMRHAAAHGLLDHDVILDVTTCRGGSRSWALLRVLAKTPFRVTHGNLRLSDVTPLFVERQQRGRSQRPERLRLREWLAGPVLAAQAAGRDYTEIVPFKLRALPADSEGRLSPAELRFRGRLVLLIGPFGRSQVDQLAVTVVDNGLGHAIGMPTAGASNTWEWEEEIAIPGTARTLGRYAWSIGHTIRPNGQVLEGNPALPHERVPLTRDNHARYEDELVRRALQHLESPR